LKYNVSNQGAMLTDDEAHSLLGILDAATKAMKGDD